MIGKRALIAFRLTSSVLDSTSFRVVATSFRPFSTKSGRRVPPRKPIKKAIVSIDSNNVMDISQASVRERLDRIRLSTEEKKAVNVKIIEGLVNPSNWIFLDDADLAESLRKLIHQGIYILFLLLYHILNFVLYICFL